MVKTHTSHALTANAMLALIEATLNTHKARDSITISLAKKASFAEYMIIASATSARHAIGLSRFVEEVLRKEKYKNAIITGRETGDWVLIDSGDVVTHIFRQEVREFYNLENLWLDT